MATEPKSILVLARRDHGEAMRVAAGLTIFGHAVQLVFMTEPVAETAANAELAELLELSEITPETTVPDMAGELTLLDAKALGAAIGASDQVINV
jgi:thioesterase domain-containing protein